jgi:hypothetical protein
MKVGDLVRLAPNSERAWYLPNAKVGIVREKHSIEPFTEPLVSVFWKEGLITREFEDELEVINESW